jgi:hypothetical protein
LEASPHARIQRLVGIIEKVERSQRLSSCRILFHYQTYLTMYIIEMVAAWWRQRQLGNTGGGGRGVVAAAAATAWW